MTAAVHPPERGRILRVITVNAAAVDSGPLLERFRAMGLADLPPAAFPDPPGQIVDTTVRLADGCNLSIVTPLAPESPIQRFLDKKGGGLASITVLVDDLDAVTARWSAAGVEWWQDEPHEFRDVEFGDMHAEVARVNWTKTGSLHGIAFEVVEFRGAVERRTDGLPATGEDPS